MLPNDLPNDPAPNPASGSTTDPPAAPTPPATPAAPQYVTHEQFMQGIAAIADALKAGHATQAPAAAPAPKTYDDPTPEQIIEDFQNGKTDAWKKLLQNERERIINDVIVPMRQQTFEENERLAWRNALADPAMPHFSRFQKDIKQALATLPAGDRAKYEAHQLAYKVVVGERADLLIKEAAEAAIRKAAEAGDGGTTPSGAKPASYPAGTPSVRELLGDDGERLIAGNGWTPDDYAKKIYRVNSWPEAAAKIVAFNKSMQEGASA